MLDEHRVFNLKKKGESGSVKVEVNWSESPDIAECKLLRFKDDDKTWTVSRDDLTAILLVTGDAKTQKDLLPMQVRKVRRVERLLRGSFKAKRSYTKGDTIYWEAPWIDEIPVDDEVLSGNIGNLTKQMNEAKPKIIT